MILNILSIAMVVYYALKACSHIVIIADKRVRNMVSYNRSYMTDEEVIRVSIRGAIMNLLVSVIILLLMNR